jgi:hypothetical protein
MGIECERVQILGRKVRPEIRSMPPNRAVLHQAVTKKDLLPGCDIDVGEQDRGGGSSLTKIYGKDPRKGVARAFCAVRPQGFIRFGFIVLPVPVDGTVCCEPVSVNLSTG